jgi:regulator of nonsense transcripts 1
MPAKAEAYVILLCREPCLRQLSQKESVYDTENWHPLIDEKKQLLKWLVSHPSSAEYRQCRQIKPWQINRMEEMWKEKPSAGLEDLKEVQVEKAYTPV